MQACKQVGGSYKRTSLIDNIRALLRHINAHYQQLTLEGKEAPAEITMKETRIKMPLDAVAKQLTAEGNGQIQGQPGFKRDEFEAVVSAIKNQAPSCLRHLWRTHLILGYAIGSRVGELHKLKFRWGSCRQCR